MADEIEERSGWGGNYKVVVRDGKEIARIDTETTPSGEVVETKRDISTASFCSPVISKTTIGKTPSGDTEAVTRDSLGGFISRTREEGTYGGRAQVTRDGSGEVKEITHISPTPFGQETVSTYNKKGNLIRSELRPAHPGSSTGRDSDSSSTYNRHSGYSGGSTGAAISRIWRRKFPKITFMFIAWTGGSWMVQQLCYKALEAVPKNSFAQWFIGIVWLVCMPGVLVGGLALAIIGLVFLLAVWLVNYIMQYLH